MTFLLCAVKRSDLDFEGRALPVAVVLPDEDEMRDERLDENARDVVDEISLAFDGFLVP